MSEPIIRIITRIDRVSVRVGRTRLDLAPIAALEIAGLLEAAALHAESGGRDARL